jgi:hypothetical protein
MIGCSRGANCPLASAQTFYRHLFKTSVADYRRQSGCLDLRVRRSDDEGRAQFLPRAVWRTVAALRGFPGVSRRTAIQHLERELSEPVAGTVVAHFEVLCLDEVELR